MKRSLFILLLLAFFLGISGAEHRDSRAPRDKHATFDIRSFGAVGDGQHIDSPAINAAISAAAAAGGGTVVIPEGVWMAYSIHLQSHVTLHLGQGAVLRAAAVTDSLGYDDPEPFNGIEYQDFGHSHWHNSLLWGEGLTDVALTGKGLIDGTGVLSRGGPRRGHTGPSEANKALALRDCQRVTISGIRFLACGHFAMLLTGVDDLLIEGVDIDSNRDGIDIDCCEHVTLRHCRVNTVNDDAIVLKCSYALGRLKPTADVLIEHCQVSGYDVGSLLDGTFATTTLHAPDGDGPTGRIKLGTESNGGFDHIRIRHCTFEHCRGLALETVDGAPMQHVRVSRLTMHDICNAPLYIRLGDRMRGPDALPSSSVNDIRLRHIDVSDADSRYACLIAGSEGQPVKNVRIRDLHVQFRGGVTLDDVVQQRGANPFFQRGNGYPEPSAHGIQPAWGFAISHASDITLMAVRLETIHADERPVLFTDNVTQLRIRRSSADGKRLKP